MTALHPPWNLLVKTKISLNICEVEPRLVTIFVFPSTPSQVCIWTDNSSLAYMWTLAGFRTVQISFSQYRRLFNIRKLDASVNIFVLIQPESFAVFVKRDIPSPFTSPSCLVIYVLFNISKNEQIFLWWIQFSWNCPCILSIFSTAVNSSTASLGCFHF